MRIVADTNVIISAVVFGGLPRRVLQLAAMGAFELCLSEAIQSEVERVLEIKFGWERPLIRSTLRSLHGWAVIFEPESSLAIVDDDPDDNRILECAVAAAAQVVVSGDRHLLQLGSFRSILIQNPRQFIASRSWEVKH